MVESTGTSAPSKEQGKDYFGFQG
jgi:ubiquinone/menaquinone biosynthesis C-methylase UbiE